MSFRPSRRGQSDQASETATSTEPAPGRTTEGGNMLPRRRGRRFVLERLLVRLVATAGIVGIGVLLGAILGSNKVQGWITGLVVAIVVLAALLWSSRQL